MAILHSVIADLKKSKKLCVIHIDNPEDYIYSQIIDSNEDITLLRRIATDSGEFDGYSLIFTENIRTISWEGELLEQLEILLEECSKEKRENFEKINNINIDSHLFKTIKRINSFFGHISVYEIFNADEFFFGQVKDIDEYFMQLRLMGDKSRMDDRNIVLRLDDIGRIDFGGIYDENMLKLHQIKKKIKSVK